MIIDRNIFLAVAIFFSAIHAFPNILKCQVDYDAAKTGRNDMSVFESLKTAVTDYMNVSQFTDDYYHAGEEISISLFFEIESYSENSGEIKTSITVASERPVYNSAYITPMLNMRDADVGFEYREGDNLEYSRMMTTTALTSLLDYYAYLAIAIDMDSFSVDGGSECYKMMQTVVNRASLSDKEWNKSESAYNRGGIMRALVDASSKSFRNVIYTYHRDGLDLMAQSPEKGRSAVADALAQLAVYAKANPFSVLPAMFHDAKKDEIIQIYSCATDRERAKVADTLAALYPSDTALSEQIRTGGI